MKKQQTKAIAKAGPDKLAFTLVELIVVITILAILGTIAFISLQGYSAQSRDSARISDLSTMKTSLELFHLDAGKYPLPTDGVDITYSGGIVWNQGIFGESAYKNVEKLDKIPTDPLTDSKYTYSVTQNRNEYEISGIAETDLALNTLDNTFAGDTQATAIVTGNYNGQTVKSLTGGTTCNMLAIPTIIANDLETSTDLAIISTNQSFVYDGYNNLPASYKSSKFKFNGGFAFSPNKLLAYTDTGSCASLTSKSSYDTRVELIQGLQESYSGTIIKGKGEIKNILDLVIDVNSPNADVINYAGNFVNNVLGGKIIPGDDIIISCNSSEPTNATIVNGTPTSPNESWQSSNPANACFFTCDAGYGSDGSSCILSTDCNSTITEITLSNSQTWSCLNLGATTVWDGTTDATHCFSSPTNCNAGLTWAGDYYQWGRNDNGFTLGNTAAPYYYGWEPLDDNKWGAATTTTSSGTYQTASPANKILMQGPCPNGWHVPTSYEWKLACDNITGTGCPTSSVSSNAVKTKLKLPAMGLRYTLDGDYTPNGLFGYYWSSSISTTFARELFYDDNNIYPASSSIEYRGHGMSLRCLKN